MKVPTLDVLLLATVAKSAVAFNLVKETPTRVVYRPNDPAVQRKIFTYGPLFLSAKGHSGFSLDSKDGTGGIGTMGLPCSATQPCTILAGRIKLKAEGMDKAPVHAPYIHHFVTYVTGKKTANPITECGRATISNAFIDAGEDSGDTDTVFTSKDGKRDSGFHISSSGLAINYDLVNDQKVDMNVYMDLEIEWIKGTKGTDAAHALKSVGTCSAATGGINLKTAGNGDAWTYGGEMTMNQDATILWARGHLHKGGKEVQLKVDGTLACSSKATYVGTGDTERLTTMSICDPIDVKKGSKIQVSSLYNVKEHPLRLNSAGKPAAGLTGSDVMGMMAMSYAPGIVPTIK